MRAQLIFAIGLFTGMTCVQASYEEIFSSPTSRIILGETYEDATVLTVDITAKNVQEVCYPYDRNQLPGIFSDPMSKIEVSPIYYKASIPMVELSVIKKQKTHVTSKSQDWLHFDLANQPFSCLLFRELETSIGGRIYTLKDYRSETRTLHEFRSGMYFRPNGTSHVQN